MGCSINKSCMQQPHNSDLNAEENNQLLEVIGSRGAINNQQFIKMSADGFRIGKKTEVIGVCSC